MADGSRVLVELRLLGAAAMKEGAKSAGRGLASLGASGKTAAAGLFATTAASDGTVSAVDRVRLAAKETTTGVLRLGDGLATAAGRLLLFARRAGTVGIAAFVAGLYEGAKATIQFDRAMANVNSIAQLTPAKLAAISKQVLLLGGKTAQQPLTLAEGLYDLVSSGFDATKSLTILRASAFAATAGLSTTAVSTHAIVAVLNAYHLSASAASHVSDELFQTVNKGIITFPELADSIGTILPYAATLHVSLSQLGGAITSLTRQGLNPQLTMTAIRQILVSMLKPSKSLTNEFSALGMTGEDLIKKQGLLGALTTLIGLTDGTKSSVAALFPNVRALNGVFALTGQNAKSAAEDVASFKDVHGATMRALAKQSLSVNYQWDKLKSTATGLAITVGQTLVPTMRKGLSAVTAFLSPKGRGGNAVSSFVAGLTTGATTVTGGAHNQPFQAPGAQLFGARVRSGASTGARQVGGFFAGLGGGTSKSAPVAAEVGRDTTTTIKALLAFTVGAFHTISSVGKTVVPVVVGYVKQLIKAFMPAIPFFKNVLLPLLIGVGVGVALTLKGLIPIVKVLATVLGFVGKVLKPFKLVIEAIGFVLGIIFGGEVIKAADAVLELGAGVSKTLGPAFSILRVPLRAAGYALDVVEGSLRFVARGVEDLVGWLGDGVTWVSRFAGTFEGGARTAVLKITNFIGDVVNLFTGMPAAIGRAAGSIYGWIEANLGTIPARLVEAAANIGVAIAKAIASGIARSPGNVASAIIGLVPGPLQGAVKKAIGVTKSAVEYVTPGVSQYKIGKDVFSLGSSILGGNGPLGLASGGHVMTGGWAVVGERGPELARLPGGSTVYDHKQTSRRPPVEMAMATPQVNFMAVLKMPDGKVLHAEVFRVERGLAEART